MIDPHQRTSAGSDGLLARCLLIVLALLASSAAHGRMQPVKPGEVPELTGNQALLLLAVDTQLRLQNARVAKDGRLFASGSINWLEPGHNYRLFVVDSGAYQWKEVSPPSSFMNQWLHYTLSDDPEFKFQVEPGGISYPGDLVYRPVGFVRAQIVVYNRALAAIDWLRAHHPGVLERYPLRYSGHYPDPFPEFYRQAVSAAPALSAEQFSAPLQEPPTPRYLPLRPGELWNREGLNDAILSPSGRLSTLVSRDREGMWLIELVELDSGRSHLLVRSDIELRAVQWSDERNLLLSIPTPGGWDIVDIIRLSHADDGSFKFSRDRFRQQGRVVDSLPEVPGWIVFANVGRKGVLGVHRVDLSSTLDVRATTRSTRTRMNAGLDDDVSWYTDRTGQVRLAVVQRDGTHVLVDLRGNKPVDVLNLSAGEDFSPIALSGDGSVMYGLSDHGRQQRDLVAFDIERRTMTQTLFSKPGVDVRNVIMDQQRRLIGVRYYEQGLMVSEYFQSQDRHLGQLLEGAFPNLAVTIVDRSEDGRQMIVWVDGADQPARMYHLDVEARTAALLGHRLPGLQEKRFASTRTVSFESADGLRMEAFLTLPETTALVPLVVYPHGGPIGIADSRHFNREVQFLAAMGYAVLQVNFRGSDGYGRGFREAGHRSLGSAIEDDIDAAIQQVLATFPLDSNRMCVIGESYGGYSALMMAVRWPERFRCAVSVSGVSDRMLFFTASDGGRSSEGRQQLERSIGDPNQELERMRATSPLYRYEQIQVPVLLAHGLEDRRVDYEHTRRMTRMLRLAGHPVVGFVFPNEGHGIDRHDHVLQLWTGIAGFLQQHLGDRTDD